MLNTSLHQQVLKQITHCIDKARQVCQQHFAYPTLSYQLRGKTAGKAYLHNNEIRLNPVLLQENPDEFLTHVIAHEVSHLITYQLFGQVKPHGKEWQSIMIKVFHLPPHTTHNLNVQSVQGKTFEYHCQCMSHSLSIRRHNKVLREQARYLCQRCQQPLIFSGKQLS